MRCEFCRNIGAKKRYIDNGSPNINELEEISICDKCLEELDLEGENE